MKTLKIFGLVLLFTFGVFMVVFGEHDDSPGAQGLGLIGSVTAIYYLLKLNRNK